MLALFCINLLSTYNFWGFLLSLKFDFIHNFLWNTRNSHYNASLFIYVSATVINFQLIPGALQVAFEEDLEFREGLPLNFLNYMGVANAEPVSNLSMILFWQKTWDLSCLWLFGNIFRQCRENCDLSWCFFFKNVFRTTKGEQSFSKKWKNLWWS